MFDIVAACAKELGIRHITFAEMEFAAAAELGVMAAGEEETTSTVKLFKAGTEKLKQMDEVRMKPRAYCYVLFVIVELSDLSSHPLTT